MKRRTLFSATDKRRTVNMSELAELTGYPVSSLREYADHNKIFGAMRVGRGHWRFEREELERWWLSIQRTQLVESK